MLVHHTGKVSADNAGSIDVFDTIRGSSSIRAVCRGTMIIAAAERNYRLCVENGWGKHDLNVVLDANTLTWRLMGNWSPAQNLTQQDQIIDCIKRLGVATLDQIHEDTQINRKSLYEQLSRLQTSENVAEKVLKEGKRRSYTYRLALFNTIQQLNSVLNSENPDSNSVRGSIQQNNIFPVEGTKGKSDQNWHSDSSPESCDSDVKNCETFLDVEYGVEKAKPLSEEDLNTNDHFSMITPTPHSCGIVEYPTSNVDTASVSPIQQLFNTIQHPPKSDHNWHSDSSPSPLTNLEKGDRVELPELAKGDKVEIIQDGQFYGKHVFVMGRKNRSKTSPIKVRGESWQIDRFYERSELRLIQRSGGQSHAE